MKRVTSINTILWILLTAFSVSACSSTGDFGRARVAPASIFDPIPGRAAQGEFAIANSNAEDRMQDATYRLVTSIDGRSWLHAVRNTAAALGGAPPQESDYYDWLRTQRFASVEGRYGKLLNEIRLDNMTLPKAFDAVCAVQETDRKRAIAANAIAQSEPDTLGRIAQRKRDNDTKIEQFTAVLNFRYDSYSYALEQLLVETPHEHARQVDNQLNILAVRISVADANQFC